MKGATALPFARARRPPNTASMRMMGRSQYFLRIRTKLHSSATKSIIAASELPGHRVRRRAWRMAIDPIGGGGAIKPKPQRILTEQAADQTDGGYGGIENQAHDHWADAGMEEQPDREPGAIEGSERSGKGQSGQEKRGGDDQDPSAHRPAAHCGPEAKEREK